jgi:hypothetical protein
MQLIFETSDGLLENYGFLKYIFNWRELLCVQRFMSDAYDVCHKKSSIMSWCGWEIMPSRIKYSNLRWLLKNYGLSKCILIGESCYAYTVYVWFVECVPSNHPFVWERKTERWIWSSS